MHSIAATATSEIELTNEAVAATNEVGAMIIIATVTAKAAAAETPTPAPPPTSTPAHINLPLQIADGPQPREATSSL